jgi:outer membrane protein
MRHSSFSLSSLPRTLASAAALAWPLAAAAQGSPGGPAREGETSWGVGIAAVSKQDAYRGVDRDTLALPMLSYENRWFRFAGLGAEIKLSRVDFGNQQALDFRLVGKYSGDGYEADDAPILSGMDERKGGFWAGVKATWHNDIAQLSAEWTADASGHSKGNRFALTLEKTWRLGQRVMLTPRLGAIWLDKKAVDYYFGVRSHEVTVTRPAYLGQSTTNAEVGLRGAYLFDRHHSVFLDVGVTRLGKEIKNSPLVDRSNENRVLMGYLYRF